MFNHVPSDYKCPICLGIQGIENENTLLKKTDLIYKDYLTSVFINSFFINGNEGHLIVVPNNHIENIYDLDPETAHALIDTTQKMAITLKKAYGCEGITLRQNNEPVADQHAFHVHFHVIPRYTGDRYNTEGGTKKMTTPEERSTYLKKINMKEGSY